jgi:hypothetical protein
MTIHSSKLATESPLACQPTRSSLGDRAGLAHPGATAPVGADGPAQPALLIGTAQTLSLLVDQLALMPGSPLPVAYIALDAPRPIAKAGRSTLGLADDSEALSTLDDLDVILRDSSPSRAIISLPDGT